MKLLRRRRIGSVHRFAHLPLILGSIRGISDTGVQLTNSMSGGLLRGLLFWSAPFQNWHACIRETSRRVGGLKCHVFDEISCDMGNHPWAPVLRVGACRWLAWNVNWQNKSHWNSMTERKADDLSPQRKAVCQDALRHANQTVHQRKRCPVEGQLCIMFIWAVLWREKTWKLYGLIPSSIYSVAN